MRAKRHYSDFIQALWDTQGGNCFHCGLPMLRKSRCDNPLRWSREHLYPRKTHNHRHNVVVLAHADCNCRRNHQEPSEDEVARAEAIYAVLGREFAPTHFDHYKPAGAVGGLADIWPTTR